MKMMKTDNEKMVYNTLNEALLAGVCVMHVGDDGEYVEYLTYESGTYFIRRMAYGNCVRVKTYEDIKDVLKYTRRHYMDDIKKGTINKTYSLDEIAEELKKVIKVKVDDDNSYYIEFTKEIDSNSNYYLVVKKYADTPQYYIKLNKTMRFSIGKSIVNKSADDNEHYLVVCGNLMDLLVEMGLEKDWYRELKVEIKNIKGERGINNV